MSDRPPHKAHQLPQLPYPYEDFNDCHDHNCSTLPCFCQTLEELDFERGIWGAAHGGELDRMFRMHGNGVDVNCFDASGYTALHYAARNGHVEVCNFLVSHGARINAVTKSGKATAIQRACSAGELEVVKLLLKYKPNILWQDADGKTVLHRAAEKGHMDIYHLLQAHEKYEQLEILKDNKGKVASEYLPDSIPSPQA